ncbi:hypothetical protein FQR65_LT14317 [Abscondita terminalis]|nr:hypothetical protein FQR65_LT14317 [Abscondita terminalis]
MDLRETVDRILQSPQLRLSLEHTVRSITQSTSLSSTVATNAGVSVRQELNQLFPSIGQNSRIRSQSRRNNVPQVTSKKFFKDVILVQFKNCLTTLKGQDKAKAYENGFAFSDVEFSTDMKLDRIYERITSLFNDKLRNHFELMVPMSGRLTKLSLEEGTQLDGAVLKRIYHQKVIYVRPTDEDIDSDNETDLTLEVTDNIIENSACSSNNELLLHNSNYEIIQNDEGSYNVLNDILENLKTKIVNDQISHFNIYREDIFQCCIRAMRRPSFDPYRKIDVKFSDVDGQSEGAVDMGGPTREMFRLVLNHLKNSHLFIGVNKKYISLDALALEKKNYFEAGRIISLSLVHGGLGPHFFSENLYTAITKGIEFTLAAIEFVDSDIQEKLSTLASINDQNIMKNYLTDENIFSIAGINSNRSLDTKYEIIDAAIKFYHLYRTKPALDQFMDGLRTCNILELIQSHANLFEQIMCHDKIQLDFKTIEEIFTIKLSEMGSNTRQNENRIVCFWRDYLLDSEEGANNCSLEDILIFATGADAIPSLGFGKKLEIHFLHDTNMKYPKANTCGLELHLPTCYTNYEDFKNNMDFGIGNSKEFGMA